MRHSLTTKKKSWFHSPVVAVVLALMIVWGVVSVARAYAKQREARALRNEYAAELRQVRAQEAELQANIDYLSTERGLEQEIRERYRVVKPGEQLVIVVENGESGSASASGSPAGIGGETRLRRFFRLLGF